MFQMPTSTTMVSDAVCKGHRKGLCEAQSTALSMTSAFGVRAAMVSPKRVMQEVQKGRAKGISFSG